MTRRSPVEGAAALSLRYTEAARAEAMQVGQLVDGRFRIERLAGRGGMGEVYRAIDESRQCPVALKILIAAQSDQMGRFEREIRVLAKLSHGHIVRYVDRGSLDDGQPYVAMEWLEGETLSDRLRQGPLETADALTVARSVAAALGAAHAEGVIHRDLKPSNLLLIDGDVRQVKLLDFGLARVVHATQALTRSGDLMGTVMYMSPEQARAAHRADARADVFALGCILFECLTGQRAFSGDCITSVLAKILFEEPPRVRDLRADAPASLDALVARLMSREATDRPDDGQEALKLLNDTAHLEARLPGPAMAPQPSLSDVEQRVVCVLVVDGPPDPARPRPNGAEPESAALSWTRQQGMRHDVTIEVLADGMGIGVVAGAAAPSDLATRAAHCALAVRMAEPRSRLHLVTGRGTLSERLPVGEAIDRAVDGLRHVPAGRVLVDELTASLLDVRFEVTHTEHGIELLEQSHAETSSESLTRSSTRFVGRTTERAVLDAMLAECCAASVAKTACIVGDAGSGKSRLVHELVRSGTEREPRLQVWVARGDPVSTGHPYSIAASVAAPRFGLRANERLDDNQSRIRSRLRRHLTEAGAETTAWFLAELAGVPFDDADRPALLAARHDPVLMDQQVRQAWVRWLRAESAIAPILLVLDDLHWGDIPSMKLIQATAEMLADAPIMIVAIMRPDAKELFGDLWSNTGAVELRIARLATADARQIALDLTGSEAHLDELVARSAGNPLFLVELCRHHQEQARLPASSRVEASLPDSVLGIVQSRISRLGEVCRRVLRAASIFGNAFTLEGVEALLSKALAGQPVLDALDELQVGDLILRAPEANDRRTHVFQHSLVRDGAYAMLTAADRVLGHRLAAGWLETTGRGDALALAEHFEKGDKLEHAAGCYLNAADRARDLNDNAQAATLAERGLACQAPENLRGALHGIAATAYSRLGDSERVRGHAQLAIDGLPAGTPRWIGAVGQLIAATGLLGDREASRRGIAQLCAAATPDVEAARAKAQELGRAIATGLDHGDVDEVRSILGELPALARQLPEDDPASHGLIHYATAAYEAHTGQLASALDDFLLAADDASKCGDHYSEIVRLGCAASVRVQLGRYEDAEAAVHQALDQAAELEARYVFAGLQVIRALALLGRGSLTAAAEVADSTLAGCEKLGNTKLLAQARIVSARIEAARGELERAFAHAIEGHRLAEPYLPIRAWALGVLSRLELARGKPSHALEHARSGMAILDELGTIEEGDAELRLAHVEALEACGEQGAGRGARAAARQRLLRRAECIEDPALRQSFLENVPENAQTMRQAP